MSDARADNSALRAATWRLAALTAGAVTVVLLVVGGLLLAVVSREQAAEARTALRQAVVDADDLMSHPSTVGVWTQAGGWHPAPQPVGPGLAPGRRRSRRRQLDRPWATPTSGR